MDYEVIKYVKSDNVFDDACVIIDAARKYLITDFLLLERGFFLGILSHHNSHNTRTESAFLLCK